MNTTSTTNIESFSALQEQIQVITTSAGEPFPSSCLLIPFSAKVMSVLRTVQQSFEEQRDYDIAFDTFLLGTHMLRNQEFIVLKDDELSWSVLESIQENG